MRRSRAPSNWPGPFFAARSWAGCTTNMFGFDLRQAHRLPATALMPANRGSQVAILGGDGKVALKAIQLGRDFGDTVEVIAGLSPQDQVIDSPPETLQSGDAVQVGPVTGSAPKPAGEPKLPATQ